MLKYLIILFVLISISQATSIEFNITQQNCPSNADFIQVLYNLPSCIVERTVTTILDGFVYSSKEFLENSLNFITTGPNLNLFCSPYNNVMHVIESLYTLALMGFGTYYIVNANDPAKRAQSKLWIQDLLLMIILLSFSFNLFKILIDLNQYLTISIYNEGFSDLLNIQSDFSSLIFGLLIGAGYVGLSLMTFATLFSRYLLIPFLLLAFPFGIMLYFLPFSKQIGSFVLKFTLLVVFMTTVDALIILGMSYLLNSGDPLLSGGFLKGLAIMLGFGLIGLINSIIYLVATISVVSIVLKSFEGVISTGWKIAVLASML
ncbi:MAG: hypothetical protein ACP5N9_04445 [Candidatus Bilamarchaeum sp.]